MRYLVALVGLLLLIPLDGHAQNRIRHSSPTVLEQAKAHELTFNVPGLGSGQVQKALLYYRYGGNASYKQTEVQRRQDTFTARLPLDRPNVSSVEYYFRIRTQDGKVLTYPLRNPASNPVRVDVVDRETETDTTAAGGLADKIAPSILSPQPDAEIAPNDAVLAVTFFYEDSSVEQGRFRVYLDGREVTDSADVGAHFLSYTPSRIGLGEHTARVTYQHGGQQSQLVKWGFSVVEASETAAPVARAGTEDYVSGRAELSSQSQTVGQSVSDVFRGQLRVEGREGPVRYNLNASLTSEQSGRLQPQNRYGAELLFGEWGELRLGDVYPTISRLTLAGRRVRGIDARVQLFGENVNAQFLYGRLRRDITNRYQSISPDVDTSVATPDTTILDRDYTLPFADQGRGTYQRNVMGARLSFGDETPIQWGLNALRVRDDTTTLNPIDDFNEVQRRFPKLTSTLNSEDEKYLTKNPNALTVSGSTPNPKDNFAASSDLHLRLDDDNIQLDAEVGVSLLNKNTRGGILTQEKAKDLGVDLDQSTEDLLSRISWLIIINEKMNTLPFRFEKANGEKELKPFVPSGIFGGQSQARFNYLGHQLRVRYRWFGPNYVSLANSTLRQDLKGLNVTDQFQLLNNQLYVTLGYETLQNNVLGTKEATTTTSTYRTNLSWYPVQRNLPRVSIDVSLRDRGNGIARQNPIVRDSIANVPVTAAVRNIRRVAPDSIQVRPNPVQTFTTQFSGSITQQFEIGSVINDATLNVSYLRTNNEVFTYGGTKTLSYSLNVRNRFANLPLDTRFGVNVNQTESGGGLSSFDIFGASVGGTAHLLNRDLRLSGTLAFTLNDRTARGLRINDNGTPNNRFDDYYEPSGDRTQEKSNSYVFNLNARYQVTQRHSIIASADINNVVAQGDRTVPNDRILELRYVFDF
ncbi:MAG: hypothetical protein ABEL51_14655 [Salinibacter sp.]